MKQLTVIMDNQPPMDKPVLKRETIEAYASRVAARNDLKTHDTKIEYSSTHGLVHVKFGCQHFWCLPATARDLSQDLLDAAGIAQGYLDDQPDPDPQPPMDYLVLAGKKYKLVPE